MDAPLEDDEIDSNCKQFVDFIQAQLHRKYDLNSSRKRPRGQHQNEENLHPSSPKSAKKGKTTLE